MRHTAYANLRHALRKDVYEANLRVRNDDDDLDLGRAFDLSITGMRILGARPLPVGRAFHLRIESAKTAPVVVRGTILWAEEAAADSYFSGVVFDPPSLELRAKLKTLRDILDGDPAQRQDV